MVHLSVGVHGSLIAPGVELPCVTACVVDVSIRLVTVHR